MLWKKRETVEKCFNRENKTGKRCKLEKKQRESDPTNCGKHQKTEQLLAFYRVDNIVNL